MDAATLGIEVDTSDIKQATEALNDLAHAAERATAALAKLQNGAAFDFIARQTSEMDQHQRRVRERGDEIREKIDRGARSHRGTFKL